MSGSVLHGDMRTVLAGLDRDSLDACVTDPPYELGFMGKSWDRSGVAFDPATWAAVYRVIRPGGYLLAFGGTRTFHRITVAIEDAGWEVKDCLCWLYGQGFPKHKSLLKPAWEPVILAKKPGPGAINVDACRVEGDDGNGVRGSSNDGVDPDRMFNRSTDRAEYRSEKHPLGRWPANVCLDESAAAALDAMSGERKSGGRSHKPGDVVVSNWRVNEGRADRNVRATSYCADPSTGGASRFFYVAKASRRERNAGLDGMPERESRPLGLSNWDGQTNGSGETMGPSAPQQNHHPTVKPIALMRWLVRLVTPPGGTVLDPFTGSGTTGIAAALEGFGFLGCELNAEYVEIAERRIAHWAREREPEPLPLFAGLAAD